MKRLFAMLCTGALLASVLTGCGSTASSNNENTASETAAQESTMAEETSTSEIAESADTSAETIADADLLTGKHHVEIEVQDYGTIKLELDADIAPISVTNFVDLVNQGFYDGLTFHRIMDGFMIQGGDPTGTGMGGSEVTIKGEFAQNGVENSMSHVRGVISMARSNDPDSASSQFFIVQSDSTFLDGQYAAFGYVTEGIEIVDQICKDAPVVDNNGTVEADNQPVITKMTVID